MKKFLCFLCVFLTTMLVFWSMDLFAADHGKSVSHSATRMSSHSQSGYSGTRNSGMTSGGYKSNFGSYNRTSQNNYNSTRSISTERSSTQRYVSGQNDGSHLNNFSRNDYAHTQDRSQFDAYRRPEFRPSPQYKQPYQQQRYYSYNRDYNYGGYGGYGGFQAPYTSRMYFGNSYQYYRQPTIRYEIVPEYDSMRYEYGRPEPGREQLCNNCRDCCTCDCCNNRQKTTTPACQHESQSAPRDRVYYYERR